jgi:hypothetical protein
VLSATGVFVTSAPTPPLTKASVTISLVLLVVVSYSFLIDDACVGVFISLCLSGEILF